MAPIDLHFVASDLAVGSAFSRDAVPRLAAEHGIARVVDVRCEERDDEEVLRRNGILLLHLPTEDRCAVSQEMLRNGVTFVEEGRAAGERTLVHCQYGVGRSALVALCALVARGDDPLAALGRAKRARAVISPAPEQLEAFAAFAEGWKAEHGAAWSVPTFEGMADIAYRHLGPWRTLSRAAARAASSRRR